MDNSTLQDIHAADKKAFKRLVETINEAIKDSKIIKISYKDSKEKVTVRDVEPMELKANGGLFGWCKTRDNVRLFKLSSIVDIRLLDTTFTKREFEKKKKHEDEIL